jgi:phage-related protein
MSPDHGAPIGIERLYQVWYTTDVDGTPEGPVLECRFYRTETGGEPVRDWLKAQNAEARQQIGADIMKVQWRWPVSKPLVDGIGGGLYEVRTTVGRREFRVFFAVERGTMLLLHGFHKTTRKAPGREIDLARRRLRECET